MSTLDESDSLESVTVTGKQLRALRDRWQGSRTAEKAGVLSPAEREQFELMDPPDAPIHYDGVQADAWGDGWLSGYERGMLARPTAADAGGLLAQDAAMLRKAATKLTTYSHIYTGDKQARTLAMALSDRAAQLDASAEIAVGGLLIGAGDPMAFFADFCERQGYPSDGDMDAALQGAFYEGIRYCSVHSPAAVMAAAQKEPK